MRIQSISISSAGNVSCPAVRHWIFPWPPAGTFTRKVSTTGPGIFTLAVATKGDFVLGLDVEDARPPSDYPPAMLKVAVRPPESRGY